MIAFIDAHRDQFGVEFICRTVREAGMGFLTSRSDRAAKTRVASARAIRDTVLVEIITTIHPQNFSVYRVKKMHAAMHCAGHRIGRKQTRGSCGWPGSAECRGPRRCSPPDPIRSRPGLPTGFSGSFVLIAQPAMGR